MKILHQIEKGDTLESIALKYGCNIYELMKVNDLTSENLSKLTTLIIPQNKTDFAVIKNLDREILVEVDESNINDIMELTKTQSFISSCNNIKNLQAGDKIIFTKPKNYYVVKPLQSLASVAKILGVSEEVLIEKNNLKSNKLFIGQKIYY